MHRIVLFQNTLASVAPLGAIIRICISRPHHPQPQSENAIENAHSKLRGNPRLR